MQLLAELAGLGLSVTASVFASASALVVPAVARRVVAQAFTPLMLRVVLVGGRLVLLLALQDRHRVARDSLEAAVLPVQIGEAGVLVWGLRAINWPSSVTRRF